VIEAIRQKVSEGRFEFTEHAVDQSIVRRISMEELRQVVATGEIIEDYPDDKYGPSCLILGYTESHRPIHVQCSHPVREILKIITVYQPDISQWINDRTRKPSDDL
jgi:hypothetical protein